MIVAVGVLLFNGVLPGPPTPADYTVDCQGMIEREWWQPQGDNTVSSPVSRFAPHQQLQTELDSLGPGPTPQVFRSVAFNLAPRGGLLIQNCQALYTDESARLGADYVEMPAHCFFSPQSIEQSLQQRPVSTVSLRSPLRNYCVFAGADLARPDKVFRIVDLQCKTHREERSSRTLVNDSCMARLDQAVPESVRNSPLRWWRPDPLLPASAAQQLKALLQIDQTPLSCNINSGNIEGQRDIYLVSHSIDAPSRGRHRTRAFGRAIYQHALEGVIMRPGLMPNTIDTRSGDSGGAVYTLVDGEKWLLGMQVAVNNGYTRHLGDDQRQSWAYLQNYNIAVNPHIAPDAVPGYPYRYASGSRQPVTE